MVDTWKDWTGARYIYMYLPDDLGLRRITFYHRQQPDDLDFFMYLVVVECHGITSREKQVHFSDGKFESCSINGRHKNRRDVARNLTGINLISSHEGGK